MSQPDQQRRPRRWFQFSLRTLLVMVAVVAGLAFGYVKLVEPYRLQREAMAVITKLGGTYKTEDATGWVRYLDSNAQDIVVVDLADCDKPNEYLPHLLRLPRLRTVVVGGHSVGDEQVTALGRVGGLKGLVLDSTKVSEDGIEGLKEKLPDIVVYKSERRAVVELQKLGASLRDRDFDPDQHATPHQPAVPPDWLRTEVVDAYFTGAPKVIADVGGTRATDADLVWLANLPDVHTVIARKLAVNGTFLTDVPTSLECLILDEAKVTDATLEYIRRFRHLTWLDVNVTPITDEGLAVVATFNDVQVLGLDETSITDKGLAHIAGLRHLQSVQALGTRVSDVGFATLTALPSIERLILTNTAVTDDGLHHVAQSKTLRRLWLNGTKITDSGVPLLQKCTTLSVLGIKRTGISPEGARRLRHALPDCEIEYDR